ncbi:Uncharacterised protein [uncultured archaeon]|nr:Uncharacterised protein [uncultured archaeon]
MLDEGGDACGSVNLGPGILKVGAELIHPIEGPGVSYIARLDKELDGICATEDVAHVSEIDQWREILGYVVLEVGIHLNLRIGIDPKER